MRKIIYLAVLIVVLGALVGGGYYYYGRLPSGPGTQVAVNVEEIIAQKNLSACGSIKEEYLQEYCREIINDYATYDRAIANQDIKLCDGIVGWDALKAQCLVVLDKRVAEAAASYDQNNFDAALKSAEAMLAENDKNVTALLLAANTWAQRGSLEFKEKEYGDKAILFANKVLAIDPKNAEAYKTIGYANEIQNKFEGAISNYEKAIAFAPSSADYRVRLGHAYDLMGDLAKAKENYLAALQLDTNNAVAHVNMGRVYFRENNESAAVAEYNKALPLTENARSKSEIYYTLGGVEMIHGNIANADGYMTKATELDATFPLAWVGLGKVKFAESVVATAAATKTKLASEALAHMDRAIKLNRNQTLAYLWKGKMLAFLGRKSEARAALVLAKEVVGGDITLVAGGKAGVESEIDAALGTVSSIQRSSVLGLLGKGFKFLFIPKVAVALTSSDCFIDRSSGHDFCFSNYNQYGGEVWTCSNGDVRCYGQCSAPLQPPPPPPPPQPSVTITAAPNPVDYYGTSTLSWTAAYVSSCSASGGWSGMKSVGSGSEPTSSLTAATTYTITCTSSYGYGPASASVTVNVNPPQHTACSNNACVIQNGLAPNTCASNFDCSACTGTNCGGGGGQNHFDCVNKACVSVAGAGYDKCASNADCGGAEHSQCVNRACVIVPGAGTNACRNDANCGGGAGQTYGVCSNNACTQVTGTPPPNAFTCGVDADCSSGPSYALRSSNNLSIVVIQDATPSCSNKTTLTVLPYRGFSSDIKLAVADFGGFAAATTSGNFSINSLALNDYATGAQFSVCAKPGASAGPYNLKVAGTPGGQTVLIKLNVVRKAPTFKETSLWRLLASIASGFRSN